jgi:hypothetical protein
MNLVLPRDSCSIEQLCRLLAWCFNKDARAFLLFFDQTDPGNQYAVSETESQLAPAQLGHLFPRHFIEPSHTHDVPLYALRRENMAYVVNLLSDAFLDREPTTPGVLEKFMLLRDTGDTLLDTHSDAGCYLANVQPSEEQDLLAECIHVERLEE